MRTKIPNYLYPLQSERTLQWTKDVVRGEKTARKATVPKVVDGSKKMDIVRSLVKDKQAALRYGKPLKTASYSNPMMRVLMPRDPMKNPSPSPGNAMHIANTKAKYYGY